MKGCYFIRYVTEMLIVVDELNWCVRCKGIDSYKFMLKPSHEL